jgi:cell fate regulator YaaT (PSP1 superfamily)
MAEVVGIRFKEVGKVYYFDPDSMKFKKGDKAIVETARGVECGEVAMENREVPEEEIVKPLKRIIRAATEADLKIVAENREKEKKAFDICEQKIRAHKLEMKLVDVEYTFDSSKILFYFTADGRVDFRELVKDLAGVFRTRIELRQIGVRDESKMIGGFGICGRPFCCSSFLGDFQPVSIKMAKEQGLSLNPTKISGTCGRLMCCLKYEQEAYEHLLRHTPKIGAIVETREGRGTVLDNNLLTGMLTIRLDRRPDAAPVVIERHQVKLIRDAQIKLNKKEIEALKGIE